MVLGIEELIVLIVVSVTWFLHISKSGEGRKKFKKHIFFITKIICSIVFCKPKQLDMKSYFINDCHWEITITIKRNQKLKTIAL